MVRYGNNFLQVCKQLDALTSRDWSPAIEGDVDAMREAMGVLQVNISNKVSVFGEMMLIFSSLQHHDAVSGTAKQAVTFDYMQR